MSNFQGLSKAPRRARTYPYVVASNGLKEGAAVMYDTAVAAQQVKAPTGAAISGFAGLLCSVLAKDGSTVAGTQYEFQRDGIGAGLLLAGQTVNVGDKLVVGGVTGALRALGGGDDACDIVGTSEETKTAGATDERFLVNLDNQSAVHRS